MQLGLLDLLAEGVFQEVGIDFVRQPGIRDVGLAACLGWAGRSGRAAGRRVLPKPATLQDLADDVVLAGVDEGDYLHGPAATGAQEGVGLVNSFDHHGPAAANTPVGRSDNWLLVMPGLVLV